MRNVFVICESTRVAETGQKGSPKWQLAVMGVYRTSASAKDGWMGLGLPGASFAKAEPVVRQHSQGRSMWYHVCTYAFQGPPLHPGKIFVGFQRIATCPTEPLVRIVAVSQDKMHACKQTKLEYEIMTMMGGVDLDWFDVDHAHEWWREIGAVHFRLVVPHRALAPLGMDPFPINIMAFEVLGGVLIQ